MARKKTTDLDATLDNFKSSALAISKVVKAEAKALCQGDYDLPILVNTAEKHARTLALLIENAPLLQVGQHIETMQSFKDWICDSSEIVGEERDRFLDTCEQYEQEVLRRTGPYIPPLKQMRLL